MTRVVSGDLWRKLALLLGLLLGWFCSVGHAQTADDIAEFFQNGRALYEKRKWADAAVELENVLLLDPKHLDAKILLVRIYGNMKETRKAQELLKALAVQAPKNAEVAELQKLFGEKPPKNPKKDGDYVLHETLTLLGKKKDPRPFGLVIPEERVKKPEIPEGQTASESLWPDDSAPAADPLATLEGDSSSPEEGPLFEVFDSWALEGLNAGLQKYFDVVGPNRALGALDDRNLLRDGTAFFGPRFKANPQDEEARYFVGMITYFSGDLEKGEEILEGVRGTEKAKTKGAKVVFGEIDKKKAAEAARQAYFKKQKEEEEARKRAEEEARAAAAAAAAASASAQTGDGSSGDAASATAAAAGPPGSPEAIDAEGYDLYKKGQLDPAIEKFEASLKLNSGLATTHYHLGLALTDKALAGSLDCFDKAIEAFNQVMRLSPGTKMARDAEIMIRDISAAKSSIH